MRLLAKYDGLMRIAVISDVHGNLLALDAVLQDIATRAVDLTVNLGDLLSVALQPRETADRLMGLDLPTISGNHERQVLTLPRAQMGRCDRLTFDTITEPQREWLSGLPETLELAPGVMAFHGSPTDDLMYLLETVEPTGLRSATDEEVLERLGGFASWPLLLCGHTHLPRARHLPTGALVVNPGSVGWPAYDDDKPYPHVVEAGSPHARYAVVDDVSGSWTAELLAVDYDWEAAAGMADRQDFTDVGRALRTGRV